MVISIFINCKLEIPPKDSQLILVLINCQNLASELIFLLIEYHL